MPCFLFPFTHQWTSGLLPPLAIVNDTAVYIGVHIFL